MQVLRIICLSLSLSTAALAAEDAMSGYYENTLLISAPGEAPVRWHYFPDHSYTAIKDGGAIETGTWLIVRGQICEGPEGKEPACHNLAGNKKPGDVWSDGPMRVELKEGQQQ